MQRTRKWFADFSVLLPLVLLVFLPSCSVKSTKSTLAAKYTKAPPKITTDSSCPYQQINYDYPLWEVHNPKIYIYKQDRRLLLVQDGVLIRDYPIALGPHPWGDKVLRGDGRTPEGDLFVCVKNPWSKYYKSLGLSYPTVKHAEEALTDGRIAPEDFWTILQAHETRSTPPWNTALGGEIFIHGGGSYKDWTLGCVAVSNSVMDELFEIVPVGASVTILP